MKTLAEFVRRRNAAILLVTVALTVAAAWRLPPLYDDDVMAFLPEGDPEIQRLEGILDRFGGMNVALVGIEADAPGLFTAERLRFVRDVAERLGTLPEVKAVTALTKVAVMDAAPGQEGGVHKELIPRELLDASSAAKATPEAFAAVRADVLGRDYIAGSLVSDAGDGTRLVVQLHERFDPLAALLVRWGVAPPAALEGGPRLSPTVGAIAIKTALAELQAPPGLRVHLGGAPFIAEAAATGSQEDLKRLGPWVCLVIVLSIVFTLGAFQAALLCLVVVGLGILWTVGLMAWLGFPLTLLSSSLPVMLVALGSAFAVHILVWYLDHGGDIDEVLGKMGGPVLASGGTAIVSFLSFLFMDLAPMRAFGWQMAVGSALLCVVAVVVIPAVLVRFPIPPRRFVPPTGAVDDALGRLGAWLRRYRIAVSLASLAAVAPLALRVPDVRTAMDSRSFFQDGSAPDLADRFMVRSFGGSVFLQVLVDGDVTNPAVIRAIAAFEDRLARVDGVTRVESLAKVLAVVNEGLTGERDLARTRAGLKQHIYLAQSTDPAVRLLVDDARSGTVIQVAIGVFDTEVVSRVTAQIRELAAQTLPGGVVLSATPSAAQEQAWRQDAAERLVAVAGRGKVPEVAAALVDAGGVDAATVRPEIAKVLQTELVEEEMVLLKEGAQVEGLTGAVTALAASGGLSEAAFAKAMEPFVDPDELSDPKAYAKGARYVFKKLEHLAQGDRKGPMLARVTALLSPLTPSQALRVAAVVDDALASERVLPDPKGAPLSVAISGYPIVQEAMTRSVHASHLRSLVFSAPAVVLLLMLVFRSIAAGLLAAVPPALTLLVTYGVMGTWPDRFPLDIAGSMLASIGIGTGIDYAIHFLWRLREGDEASAMRTTARRILINAIEISAGFSVLALATIAPMARFGILTAITLGVAAVATLILVPALAGLWRRRA